MTNHDGANLTTNAHDLLDKVDARLRHLIPRFSDLAVLTPPWPSVEEE